MFLEIVTPEAILLSSEVDSIIVPGINGDFQMLNNHAAVVSILKEGIIQIDGANVSIDENFEDKFSKSSEGKILFTINSGTLEFNNNKAIILAD